MDSQIQTGDVIRIKEDRQLYLCLGPKRQTWDSAAWITCREFTPGVLFPTHVKLVHLVKSLCVKDVFQTLLMQAQLRAWFSKEETDARVGPE